MNLGPVDLPVMACGAVPRATHRVQLHRGFDFDAAAAQLGYWSRLGISHLFVSPVLTARAGSTHGYDVVDHTRINPELGGEPALRRLVQQLRRRGMGLIVDVVPNHMAVGKADNPRWLDVLEWGHEARNAAFFDIDWDRTDPALTRRVHLPFLGEPYGEALAQDRLVLRYDLERGRFQAEYADHVFPLAPEDYVGLLGAEGTVLLAERFAQALRERSRPARWAAFEQARGALDAAARGDAAVRAAVERALAPLSSPSAAGRERLHRLLERQHYRLAWWRTAADEINWRRFFDVTELAAIRVQERAVFEAAHDTLFRLYAEGLIDGLRIDHVDGLADPRGYCRQLRVRLQQLARQRPEAVPRGRSYVVVEKILAPGERLAEDWRVDGTSGYSFMNDVGALMHDPQGHEPLSRYWAHAQGRDFDEEERRARRSIPQELFAADFAACAHALHQLARRDPATRDWTLGAIRRVLAEILVQFPVYRTYADGRGRSEEDARIMAHVLQAAAPHCRAGERPLLAQIDAWLGGEPLKDLTRPAERRLRLRALARFQQLTSPVAAKAVEDTAFYRHARLLSRNEVGADPRQFSLDAASFHRIAIDRRARYPHALLATATHDHKRGEDVRARLSMLSECAPQWVEAVERWRAGNAGHRLSDGGGPDAIDEYVLYQTLVGSWPLELSPTDAAGLRAWADRLQAWQLKALREAKRHTRWTEPDAAYEQACAAFLDALLDPARAAEFLSDAHAFVQTLAAPAAMKSLGQVLLRLTVPGVPDLYQGTEYWDFSLVDPDNRRPVDYAARAASLQAVQDGGWPAVDWRQGAVKQWLIACVLALRAQAPLLFAHGDYRALPLHGPCADRFLAFTRQEGRQGLAVIVPIRGLPASEDGRLRPSVDALADCSVQLPPVQPGAQWRDALTGEALPHTGHVPLASLLMQGPVALLHTRGA